MTPLRLLPALLLASLAAGGCSSLRPPGRETPAAVVPAAARPLPAGGLVALDGFATNGPLTIPPTGLTLQAAVRAAGSPAKADRQPTELFFVRLARGGQDTVTPLWAVPNTALGTIALKDGDQLTFLDQAQAADIGYLDKNDAVPNDGSVITLGKAFRQPGQNVTGSFVALIERVVRGRATTLVFPNPFVGTPEHVENSPGVANLVKLRKGEAVFLEPEDVPLVQQGELERAVASVLTAPPVRVPVRRGVVDTGIQRPRLCEFKPVR